MGQSNIQEDCRAQARMLRSSATYDPSDAELPLKIAIMDNEIAKGDYDTANKIPIDMSESENTTYGNEWSIYREQNTKLESHIGQAYSLILVQYKQLLQYNINQDTDCNAIITYYNPLVLL